MRRTAKKFTPALAAFKWCQRGRIKMVYFPPGTVGDPLRNWLVDNGDIVDTLMN